MAVNNFNYALTWSDFIHLPARPTGVNEDAAIQVNFPQQYAYETGRKGTTITTLSVDIELAAPECWVVSTQATNLTLLKHEQGHYDITALGAREFHEGLVGLSAANENALKASIRRLRASIQQKINRANARYDTQTNHSSIVSVQQTWDQKIEAAKKNARGTIDDLP